MGKKNYQIGIIVSDFNEEITTSLLKGALDTFEKNGVPKENIKTIHVPGAFELPLAALQGIKYWNWNAVVCLGCVIRGGTPHFDFVAAETARGIMEVGLQTMVPTIFGVLTTDTYQQAQERSGITPVHSDDYSKKRVVSHKGIASAEAALQMLENLKEENSL